MGMMFGGWAREEDDEYQWYLSHYGPIEGALKWYEYQKLQEDRRLHPENYPDIVEYRKKLAKRYQVEGCPEVRWKDVIVGEDGIEMFIQDIDEDKKEITVKTVSNTMDKHQGVPYVYTGKYKVLRSIGYE